MSGGKQQGAVKCAIAGCPYAARALGLCRNHYQAQYRRKERSQAARNLYSEEAAAETTPLPTITGPVRPFLYTLDQIASLVSIDERELIAVYLFLEGRSLFTPAPHHLHTRNIAPPDKKPDWRVIESEFIRWLRYLGFSYIPPGSVHN